jgi:hypothetical protein
MRGAFAYFDSIDGDDDNTRNTYNQLFLIYNPAQPHGKFARNASNYPEGYRTIDNSWALTFTPSQMAYFDWDGTVPTRGRGVHSLATALSRFGQFQRCMVDKVAELVCPSDPNDKTLGKNQVLGQRAKSELVTSLKAHGDLRRVFEEISVRPECLGR